MRRTWLSGFTAGLLLLSACAGLGSIGDILGSIGGTGQQQQQQGQMQAEVQQIDTNGQRIYIRTQNGQSDTGHLSAAAISGDCVGTWGHCSDADSADFTE
jgi:hypothetical protein